MVPRRGPGSASNAATIKYKRDPLTPGAGRGRSPLRHTQRRVWRPATATSMPAAGLLASAYSTPARRAAGTPRPEEQGIAPRGGRTFEHIAHTRGGVSTPPSSNVIRWGGGLRPPKLKRHTLGGGV